MSLRIALISLLAIVVGCHSACQDAKPQDGFDNSKGLGEWYVLYMKTPFDDERGSKCIKSIFEASKVNMIGENLDVHGEIFPDKETHGRFRVTWKGKDFDFVVTDIDYDHYALSTACTEGETEGNPSFVFLHSRTRDLPQDTIDKLKKKLEDRKIDFSTLTKINQEGC